MGDDEVRNTCPDCDAPEMVVETRVDTFLYGETPVTVTIPVWICPNCGFGLTDWEAEAIRMEALRQKGLITNV